MNGGAGVILKCSAVPPPMCAGNTRQHLIRGMGVNHGVMGLSPSRVKTHDCHNPGGYNFRVQPHFAVSCCYRESAAAFKRDANEAGDDSKLIKSVLYSRDRGRIFLRIPLCIARCEKQTW